MLPDIDEMITEMIKSRQVEPSDGWMNAYRQIVTDLTIEKDELADKLKDALREIDELKKELDKIPN